MCIHSIAIMIVRGGNGAMVTMATTVIRDTELQNTHCNYENLIKNQIGW